MPFKTESKEQYTLIHVQNGSLDASVAAELADLCAHLSDSGTKNFIVDCAACTTVVEDFVEAACALSAECYEGGRSFVLTQTPPALTALLKQADAIDLLNCAPTFAEAVDIVSMEILERDLYDEE
jgi:anti-anti-sigma regulatory factor